MARDTTQDIPEPRPEPPFSVQFGLSSGIRLVDSSYRHLMTQSSKTVMHGSMKGHAARAVGTPRRAAAAGESRRGSSHFTNMAVLSVDSIVPATTPLFRESLLGGWIARPGMVGLA